MLSDLRLCISWNDCDNNVRVLLNIRAYIGWINILQYEIILSLTMLMVHRYFTRKLEAKLILVKFSMFFSWDTISYKNIDYDSNECYRYKVRGKLKIYDVGD